MNIESLQQIIITCIQKYVEIFVIYLFHLFLKKQLL